MNLSSLGWYFLYGFLIAQIASLATTVYLHRSSTHRAVIFHPAVEFFWQIILWLFTGIKRDEWVAVHLAHHANPDKFGDPHSPVLLGFWKVQLGNVFLYRRAVEKPEVMWYARNIKPTWAERTIFRNNSLGLIIGISLACSIMGIIPGLIISAVHAGLYLFFLNNLINGYCHFTGYKNFSDTVAFNSKWVALITMGEGLHNNHHKSPGSAKFSVAWSEPDPGWLALKILTALKLAKV